MNGPTFATAPAAAKPAARPAPPRPHKAEADNPAARILAYLRLHWLTVVFAGALLGGGLGFAAWAFLPPKSESYALFRVAQTRNDIGGSSQDDLRNRSSFTTDVKTFAALVKTQNVYRAALRNPQLRISELATLKGEKDPIKFLDEKLQVGSKEGSELITMSLQGEHADDLPKIVDAMVKAYEDEVINKDANAATERKKQLGEAKVRLEDQLRQMGGAVPAAGPVPLPPATDGANVKLPADGAKFDPLVRPAAVGDRKGELTAAEKRMAEAEFNPLMTRRNKMQEEQKNLELNMALAKTNVEKVKERTQEVMDEPVPAELEQQVKDRDPDYLTAKAKADRAEKSYEQKFAQARDKDAEALRRLEREVEAAQVAEVKLLREKVKALDHARREPRLAALRLDLTKMQMVYDAAVNAHAQNVAEIAKVEEKLKGIPVPQREQIALDRAEKGEKVVTTTDMALFAKQEEYRRVVQQYEAAELNASTPSRVSVRQGASTPMQKDAQKQLLGAGFAGLMGFALVAAVMVGLEMRARKVTSLAELRATAPVPVVGVVPHAPDAATARDPLKRAEVNESIDKLRAYVAQSWLSRGATTVAVTSPLGDEGKSFTAFGLASSLAQAGFKTLLVDFDLRTPCLHALAGVPNGLGVCELLRGEADFRKTIQVLPNGLHFLAGGKWSDEARQAAVGGRLEALLTRLKEPFDCVVLHADALLTVAESVEVARRSDVLLLAALYRTTRTPLLKKATDRAAAMEIPYTGVVYVGATASEALC